MKKRCENTYVVVGAAILSILFGSAAHAQTRIMCLGASITQGYGPYASYRYPLWFALQEAGYSVDFVGQLNMSCNGGASLCFYPAYNSSFDRDHEGHCGWTTAQLSHHILNYTNWPDPAIVLIHAGTNDIGLNGASGVTNNKLREIIDRIRVRSPNVTILLSKLIPIGTTSVYGSSAGFVVPLNDDIAMIVAEKNTPQSPVILVDQHTGFHIASMMQDDDLHPNTAGEQHMSDVWAAALLPVLGLGASCPHPQPATSENSLLALYTFDDGTARDVSGSDNKTCVECGMPAFGVEGREGLGMSLDGLAYLRGDISIDPSLKPRLTLGAWVRPFSVAVGQALISHDNGNFDRTISIDYRGGGIGWSAFVGTGFGVNQTGVMGVFPVRHLEWQFVATAYDKPNQTVTLYVDGQSNIMPGDPGEGHPRLHIGHEPFCNATGCGQGQCGFAGVLDNVFFISEALNIPRLDEIYTFGYHRIPTCPVIIQQPSCRVVCAGASTSFLIDAAGSEMVQPLTYQWRKSGDALPGATTAILSLASVSQGDGGSYDCVVTNGCGSETSHAVTLAVVGSIAGDGNGDGSTNGLDIAGFVSRLISGPPIPGPVLCAYDINIDGVVNLSDVSGFVGVLLQV